MPANLSIKSVPAQILERLRQQAARHHRSLQGELLAILEEAGGRPKITVEEAEERLKRLDLHSPDESTAWIREMRDAR